MLCIRHLNTAGNPPNETIPMRTPMLAPSRILGPRRRESPCLLSETGQSRVMKFRRKDLAQEVPGISNGLSIPESKVEHTQRLFVRSCRVSMLGLWL